MQVRIFATLRPLVGAREVEVEVRAGDTVRIVLEGLEDTYPALYERIMDEDGSIQTSIHVLVNGRSVKYLQGLDTAIGDDDRLALFPAVGGG
jgi:molybdopterin synthase sulfur carrier subunit